MKAIVAALSAAVLCSVSAANAGEISVGVTPVPHGEVMEFVKPIVAKLLGQVAGMLQQYSGVHLLVSL